MPSLSLITVFFFLYVIAVCNEVSNGFKFDPMLPLNSAPQNAILKWGDFFPKHLYLLATFLNPSNLNCFNSIFNLLQIQLLAQRFILD